MCPIDPLHTFFVNIVAHFKRTITSAYISRSQTPTVEQTTTAHTAPINIVISQQACKISDMMRVQQVLYSIQINLSETSYVATMAIVQIRY